MNKFTTLLLASVCASSLLVGCSGKDGDPGPAGTNGTNGNPGPQGPAGPAGPSGQNLTGNLFGFVNPLDEYGNPVAKNGVTVTLDGVTPATTATTDANGRFEFTGLRNGTYNLTFTKTGLSTFRRIGVGHVGGDQPTFQGTSLITAPSSTVVNNLIVSSVTSTNVSLSAQAINAGAPAGYFPRTTIFASPNSGVTAVNGTTLSVSNSSYNISGQLQLNISKATLNSAGFASGSPVFLTVYGSPSFLTSYTDPTTGKPVFSGLGAPSNQVAFIAP